MASLSSEIIDTRDYPSAVSEIETGSSRCWLSWRPTSERLLELAEARILKHLKTRYERKYVHIEQGHNIWTLKFNPTATNTPMVMVHGFGGGLGLWVLNLDHLSRDRSVYAFDLLGFGRSSRPRFGTDAEVVEREFVSESIESWRKEQGLEKFILLGHSLGGFLSCCYALQHPERVKHLILVDPWGFPEKPPKNELPRWIKVVAAILGRFNPLASLRAAGPWGPSLVQRFRPDFQRKYSDLFDDDTILNYIYHCNAQKPSGEIAFKRLTVSLGWAKYPLINRIGKLDQRVPITFVHGSESWMENESAFVVKDSRQDIDVKVKVIEGAGHHIYADEPEAFNKVVDKVYNQVDADVQVKDPVIIESSV